MIWAIVPVKSFHDGKTRLADALNPKARSALIKAMFLDVIAALKASTRIDRILIISADPAVLLESQQLGLTVLKEPDNLAGLNACLTFALEHCQNAGATQALIIHADLPMANASDIDFLLDAHDAGQVTIMPSGENTGTNAMVLDLPASLTLSFGENSYQRHCEIATKSGLHVRTIGLPALALDIDIAADLQVLLERIRMFDLGHTQAFIQKYL